MKSYQNGVMQLKDDFVMVQNFRTGKSETVSTDGLLNLANAIIIRACDDYILPDYEHQLFSIEKFLKSDWALVLMRGSINADRIIDHLRRLKDGK